MTSKEALEILKGTSLVKSILEPIEKDLERLEILESELKLEKDKVKYIMGQLKKQDKILEIIKEKKVNVNILWGFIECCDKPLEMYNSCYIGGKNLTQEEYDLIKDWLNE